MSSNIQTVPSSPAHSLQAQVLDTTARWVEDADDVVLGCECANPALQIEMWAHQDAAASARMV